MHWDSIQNKKERSWHRGGKKENKKEEKGMGRSSQTAKVVLTFPKTLTHNIG